MLILNLVSISSLDGLSAKNGKQEVMVILIYLNNIKFITNDEPNDSFIFVNILFSIKWQLFSNI